MSFKPVENSIKNLLKHPRLVARVSNPTTLESYFHTQGDVVMSFEDLICSMIYYPSGSQPPCVGVRRCTVYCEKMLNGQVFGLLVIFLFQQQSDAICVLK